MKTFYYQILRYIHDQFTGEFVNLGVVIYSPNEMFLKAKVTQRYTRITSMFPEANGKYIINSARYLENQINHQYAPRLNELFPLSPKMEHITSEILRKDDSSLQLTEVQKAIDIDLDAALSGIFNSLVEKYLPEEKSVRMADEDVWRKKYKDYFDRYKVSDRLIPHAIQTKNDLFQFDKAWKNEIWHIYEPLSFDLKKEETVKDKVYRWAGRINELSQAKEPCDVTFMVMIPTKHAKLEKFIKNSLQINVETLNIKVVTDSQAEFLAKEIAYQMELHDSHE
jgi:hypothetical protein